MRVFLIVLDSFGVGEAPDAYKFGDEGSNTLRSISRSGYFKADCLINLGLANIDGIRFLKNIPKPLGAYGKAKEVSAGKDTTTGHWEMAGLISEKPMPVYPDGFPADVIEEFERLTGRKTLCNKPYSGTQVIHDYGREHIETGALIVYTSADSVFQIAAHEDIVSPEELYGYCRIARKILTGKNSVGRVIARPFTGTYPNYIRTPRRHDFSLEPHGKTMLDAISGAGLDVISVGKINDIFAGRSVTRQYPTVSNEDGMDKAKNLLGKDFSGLAFINLVEFDSTYGHRNDVDGYAKAIAAFDSWLPSFLSGMSDDDILIITADHGCDPATESTDHSREYIPIICAGKKIRPVNIGIRNSFCDIAATVTDILNVGFSCPGTSFKKEITED